MNNQLLEKLSVITEEEQRLLDGKGLDMTAYSANIGSVDASFLLEAGKLITVRPNTRFIAFPKHTHNYVEMVYMCKGSQKHIIGDNTEIILKEGELLLLNQHAFHQTGIAGKDDIAVNFIVLPQFFDTVLELIGSDNQLSKFIVSGLAGNGYELNFMHFNVADVVPVQNLLENLIYNIVNKSPNRRNINQVTMGLLFLNLLNFTDRLITDAVSSVADSIVMAALREIEENYVNASLSRVAAANHVTVAYVSRLVKEMTGNTFKELLLKKRLDKAAVLLKTTKLSIGDIILIVGYENTSYFYKVFTEHYGMSPKSFRQTG
ncbi:MAG: helix-turn-helix domain-containing protein [Ruminococcaceae bacterium]|nr:helix-turn-helix domain-containing protein [Oscillospiraceae bacterium]